MAKVDRRVEPGQVFQEISKWLLRDGFDIVVDMEKSKGSHMINKVNGEDWLDFYTFFASAPFGMNHPKLDNPEFKEIIFRAAINKVASSDIYTDQMAQFVKTFGDVAVPRRVSTTFSSSTTGPSRWRTPSRSPWTGRSRSCSSRASAAGGTPSRGRRGTKVIHFNDAFHGRSGYTLTVTNTQDPNKYKHFAQFDWPRVLNPKIYWPLEDNLGVVTWLGVAIKQIKEAIWDNPDDICAIIIETIQGEGGDNHFRTEFFQQLREICDEEDILLIFDEVQCGMGITGKMWAFEHHAR